MPDNIIFNTIPTDIRTPGQYVEIDNAKALRGLPSLNRRILVVGNKPPAGTAAPLTLCRVNSGDEGATLFGRGSVLHEMLRLARAANKTSDIWALGVEDLAAGVAATKTITVTGPAAAAGTIAPTSTVRSCRSVWLLATPPRPSLRRSLRSSMATRTVRSRQRPRPAW